MKNLPDKIVQYQIECLRAELEHLESNPLARGICGSPVFQGLTRHAQNFYWTLSRLAGRRHGDWRPDDVPPPRPALALRAPPAQQVPRILIDVTQTFFHGNTTGIPRVVREIAKAAAETGSGLPVFFHRRDIISYYRHERLADKVEVGEGDILLLFDASWYAADAYLPIMRAFAAKGGKIVLGLHDLVPLLYPALGEGMSGAAYRAWLEGALPMADAIVANSKCTALDARDYIAATGLSHKPNLKIGWCHLGSDFAAQPPAAQSPAAQSAAAQSQRIVDLCRRAPYFLTVGTLEPRKGHRVALAAFDKLWRAGADVRYLLIGKCGWNVRALRGQILEHGEYGRRLFWLDQASDADVRHAYRHAAALVLPSLDEGFGLPLVEAARFGVPVIASDIPVFREIAGESITYFDVLDSDALAERISDALAGKTIAPAFPIQTWREATEKLLGLIRTGSYQASLAGAPAGMESSP